MVGSLSVGRVRKRFFRLLDGRAFFEFGFAQAGLHRAEFVFVAFARQVKVAFIAAGA